MHYTSKKEFIVQIFEGIKNDTVKVFRKVQLLYEIVCETIVRWISFHSENLPIVKEIRKYFVWTFLLEKIIPNRNKHKIYICLEVILTRQGKIFLYLI